MSEKQLTFFSDNPIAKAAPKRSPERRKAVTETFTDTQLSGASKSRLGGQNGIVLELLERGPCTNEYLDSFVGRVNSRISDVRKWLKENRNQTIKTNHAGFRNGVCEYSIVEWKDGK